MKQKLNIVVPKDWSAVNLRTYINLYSDLKGYMDNNEAQIAALFYHLCGVTPDIMIKLDSDTFQKIRQDLERFVGNQELELVRKFEWNGIKYGFYPDLSKIEYGAYLDLMKLNNTEMNENWAKAMGILYRPIIKEMGKLYEVQSYTGEEEWEWWLDVGMDIHFGAWFFFINLSMDLLNDIQNSTMEMMEKEGVPLKKILQRNGETTQP